MKEFKSYIILVFKGIGMGAANVIPGVSGGTVALITGIFEKLINSIKSFDLVAVQLLFKGRFREFSKHVNFWFLVCIFGGIGISIVSLAKILDYLFVNYPIFIWAYFFGLILASIYFVGKTVKKWDTSTILTFLVGAGVAISISFLNPATENEQFIYLVICGAVAVCSMILPGLSGSFVLILLGNYQLVFIKAVNDWRFDILLPVVIGAVVGLVAFSHFLSWIYKKHRSQTISTLTGFILGSLSILWPWKKSFNSFSELIPTNKFGAFVDQKGEVVMEEIKVYSYEQILPKEFNSVLMVSIGLIILGILSIALMEKFAGEKTESTDR